MTSSAVVMVMTNICANSPACNHTHFMLFDLLGAIDFSVSVPAASSGITHITQIAANWKGETRGFTESCFHL